MLNVVLVVGCEGKKKTEEGGEESLLVGCEVGVEIVCGIVAVTVVVIGIIVVIVVIIVIVIVVVVVVTALALVEREDANLDDILIAVLEEGHLELCLDAVIAVPGHTVIVNVAIGEVIVPESSSVLCKLGFGVSKYAVNQVVAVEILAVSLLECILVCRYEGDYSSYGANEQLVIGFRKAVDAIGFVARLVLGLAFLDFVVGSVTLVVA